MEIKPLDGRVKRTYHLEDYQVEVLKILSAKTRVKQVDYVREAIDDLILKYQQQLPKNLTKSVKKNSIKNKFLS